MTWQGKRAALGVIYHWLHIYFREWEKDKTRKTERDLDAALDAAGTLLSQAEIEQLRSPRPPDRLEHPPHMMRIRPPNGEGGAIAATTLLWYREADREHCRINYGVWTMVDPPAGTKRSDGGRSRIPIFCGYRFETPERGANHAYHHSQPCRSFGDKDAEDIPEAFQTSVRYPTWPLAAKDEVQMAICLVLALYGFIGFEDLREHAERGAKEPAASVLKSAFEIIEEFQIIR